MAQEVSSKTTMERIDPILKIHATASVMQISGVTDTASTAAGNVLPAGVVKLVKHQYRAAADCLADAFALDHVARYFIDCPDTEHWTEQKKWSIHVNILEYISYAHILNGLVLGIPSAEKEQTSRGEQRFDAIALWMPPGANMDDIPTIIRSGLWRLYYQLSTEGRIRFFDEFFPLLHHSKEEVLAERDAETWYLVYIGTRSTARGKGYAKRLIKAITDQTDVEGRACYLESSNEVNLKIYGRLGFDLRKTIALERGPERIEMHVMVREPSAV